MVFEFENALAPNLISNGRREFSGVDHQVAAPVIVGNFFRHHSGDAERVVPVCHYLVSGGEVRRALFPSGREQDVL